VLYEAFPGVGGIVHTHSRWATVWAQAGRPIPPLGTTHADHFHGEIPCTRELTPDEVAGAYEEETGRVIVETFEGRDPLAVPAVLVRGHGPFAWGHDVDDALRNALVLEMVAELALHTLSLAPDAGPIAAPLLDRHYTRKHGPGAYYGQPGDPAAGERR
jgi:L-ribulose-5-phosphate 4-epimerase